MLKRWTTVSKLVLWKYGQMYSQTELAVESYCSVQFYSIPNIDGAMGYGPSKPAEGPPRVLGRKRLRHHHPPSCCAPSPPSQSCNQMARLKSLIMSTIPHTACSRRNESSWSKSNSNTWPLGCEFVRSKSSGEVRNLVMSSYRRVVFCHFATSWVSSR